MRVNVAILEPCAAIAEKLRDNRRYLGRHSAIGGITADSRPPRDSPSYARHHHHSHSRQTGQARGSRVDLAVSWGLSPTYLQLLESGYQPHGHALQRVLRDSMNSGAGGRARRQHEEAFDRHPGRHRPSRLRPEPDVAHHRRTTGSTKTRATASLRSARRTTGAGRRTSPPHSAARSASTSTTQATEAAEPKRPAGSPAWSSPAKTSSPMLNGRRGAARRSGTGLQFISPTYTNNYRDGMASTVGGLCWAQPSRTDQSCGSFRRSASRGSSFTGSRSPRERRRS